MASATDEEMTRKFRVLQQTLSMHCALRDRYTLWAEGLDLALLGCSVVFCATTFASDEAFRTFAISGDAARSVLGWAAVAAFFLSLASLLLKWKEKSSKHDSASHELTSALALFRDLRDEKGTWPAEKKCDLERAYWDAMENDAPISTRDFSRLKAKHLRNIEINRLIDKNPGCPVVVLRCILLCHSLTKVGRIWHALNRDALNATETASNRPKSVN
jgi:hypothetical protein